MGQSLRGFKSRPPHYLITFFENFILYKNQIFFTKEEIYLIKKIFFILSLALIAVSLTCVSASDVDSNVTADLQDLAFEINLTDVGETLNLEHDYKSTNSSNQIIISKPITIDGNHHTIDAPDVNRVFLINADNVCIKNLNFINSRTTGFAGGVISW